MEQETDEPVESEKHGLKERVSGLGQKIIGEIETLAGVINADPLAQAEGEFNVEVGGVRQEIEEDLKDDRNDEDADLDS